MPYRGVERAPDTAVGHVPDTAVGHVPDTGVRYIPIKDGDADYFVFNVSDDNGFVIVSGDDRARPVSGHSHEGSFDPDDLPDGLRWMLEYYQDEINWAEDEGIEPAAGPRSRRGGGRNRVSCRVR